ncbi:TetR/AcrR family transcriptional regulator [Brachybacterium sacelli]|uniref:AcrR family transcriptional regulator n=1 Tax=Brachybacterium sacelli TaxID=173364 RepID=A0ABS4X721_9MICO|nr:TetR family transcriptional regulator [Brachybacterium sacelli]MBP2384262.1 AcrR family transcriptional regulator [Brachybacterium sacelli]
MVEQPADERILQAALRRFAVDGLSAPLRRVAQDAGVSAGLIIHHFGTREKLLEACDARALEVARREKSSVLTHGAGELMAQMADVERYAPVIGFVLRRLQAGGPLAQQLVDDFAARAVEYLAEGVESGRIAPSHDPEGRARVLSEMALGALLLQLPAQRDHLDLDELPRWLRGYSERIIGPLLELYTVPLLTDSSFLDAYRDAHTAQPDPPTP